MLLLLLGAVLAGVLTTLAPCVLPMLPVIVGGSIGSSTAASRRRAYIITASLGMSIVVFTLILKVSTSLIGVPTEVWQWISGGLLIGLGLVSAFPSLWEHISARLGLQQRSTQRLVSARSRQGTVGAVLTGAALGPVFSSCSPMYGYVVVTVLPASLGQGLLLLGGYVLGLCATLLAVALVGQRFIGNARWASDPHSWFRRGLGVVFILVGLTILTGLDRDIQTWILEHSPIAPWELDSGFIPETS
ncbi:MAG: cytochrome c biogenesis protein CcdA [Actinomycetota bacterium]|nr:cytochrome c biogenesis protein CcdA [Actinomycetota bacterium]MDP2287879.1 cytochrome c biogenesis protein CcdA [Actinomycetota bacterium]